MNKETLEMQSLEFCLGYKKALEDVLELLKPTYKRTDIEQGEEFLAGYNAAINDVLGLLEGYK
ncbi:MAG: hypothetical protein ACUVWN_04615 [bacterium]